MRFNILSIYIISLLTVSCVEKENTDKKIEIYLTNKRIESYEGIKPENLKDTTKFKDLLVSSSNCNSSDHWRNNNMDGTKTIAELPSAICRLSASIAVTVLPVPVACFIIPLYWF